MYCVSLDLSEHNLLYYNPYQLAALTFLFFKKKKKMVGDKNLEAV